MQLTLHRLQRNYYVQGVGDWHTREEKLLILFSHKKYSFSFITLRLNHWCHMGYFNDVLTTFFDLERGSCVAVYPGSESSRFL